ncbi:hypothetical protein EC915_101795 [Pseudomonas sp. LP_7_YM]|nr:hypothetical protein EC915_101795 [Pseudomonas sp. LP_7_YM]
MSWVVAISVSKSFGAMGIAASFIMSAQGLLFT